MFIQDGGFQAVRKVVLGGSQGRLQSNNLPRGKAIVERWQSSSNFTEGQLEDLALPITHPKGPGASSPLNTVLVDKIVATDGGPEQLKAARGLGGVIDMAEERVWEMQMGPGMVGCPHGNKLALLQVDRRTDGPWFALAQLHGAANGRNFPSSELLFTCGIRAEEDDVHFAVTKFYQICKWLPKQQLADMRRSKQKIHVLNAGIAFLHAHQHWVMTWWDSLMTCLLHLTKPGASNGNGLATFLGKISIVGPFFRRVALQHNSLHRYRSPKVLDFRAVCVAWVLDHYETGCNQLQGPSLAGLGALDNTRAFPEELRNYVARTGGLPPAVSAARSADAKCLHSLGLHEGSYLGKIPKGCGLGNE